jgi:hypothetical protein
MIVCFLDKHPDARALSVLAYNDPGYQHRPDQATHHCDRSVVNSLGRLTYVNNVGDRAVRGVYSIRRVESDCMELRRITKPMKFVW